MWRKQRKNRALYIAKPRRIGLFLLLFISGLGLFLNQFASIPNVSAANPGDQNFTLDPTDITACAGQTECFAFHIDTRLISSGATTGTATTFSIPTSGYVGGVSNHAYDWIVDWGDSSSPQTTSGTSSTTSGGITHTYSTADEYQIAIRPNTTTPVAGWFNAFGFYSSSSGANTSANEYKVLSIDTPFTNLMRTQGASDRFSYIFYYTVNGLGIPSDLFTNVVTTGDTDMSYMFYCTFCYSAYNSTTATIPASLFSSIDTSSAIDLSGMFTATFADYAYRSTATVPAGLFDSIRTPNATNFYRMFEETFHYYAARSTMGDIPTGLFGSIDTSNATSMARMFLQTFCRYANESTNATIPEGLFDGIDTSGVTDLSYLFYETFREYAEASTIGTIPVGLFKNINTSSATNLNMMFRNTFCIYALESTIGTIPAGLLDAVDTSNATNLNYMFFNMFYDYAELSTVGSIPDGLFDSVNISSAVTMAYMFGNTFAYFAQNSTMAVVPENLFDAIVIPATATDVTGVFGTTFAYHARRTAQFVDNGLIVSTQAFASPYSTKVGANGTPSNSPTLATGDKVYPTYNATVRTINAPTDPQYAAYTWYATDGTSCSVANPTPDCGIQDTNAEIAFPSSTYWTPSTSTELGNVTFYSLNSIPTVTAVSPDKGVTDITGQVITITGTDFTNATAVTVGGEACAPFAVNSDTEISCTLPSFNTAGAKSVLVTTPGGTNSANTLYTVITQYISLSTSGDVPISVLPNLFSSSKSTVTVSTNNPNGYTLSLQAASSDLARTTAPFSTISTLAGFSAAAPSSATDTSNLIGSSSFWVYRVNGQDGFGATTAQETNTASTNYSWATVPTTNTTIRAGTITDDMTTDTPQTTDVWYGASATWGKPSGNYTTMITYTVVAGT